MAGPGWRQCLPGGIAGIRGDRRQRHWPAAGAAAVRLLDTVTEQTAGRARSGSRTSWRCSRGCPLARLKGRTRGQSSIRGCARDPQREAAKAAELTAAGEPASVRTLTRMRQRYESQGLWGLVDHRNTRPAHRSAGSTSGSLRRSRQPWTSRRASTGTRERAWRRAQEILHRPRGIPGSRCRFRPARRSTGSSKTWRAAGTRSGRRCGDRQ